MKKIILSIFLLAVSFFLFAQKDTLVPLTFNKSIGEIYFKNNLNQSTLKQDTLIFDTIAPEPVLLISLPFIDDFAQEWIYPNSNRWTDNYVYVNSNYPVNPKTYGVATFDGLDEKGYPYDFNNPTAYGIADKLTSRLIDLSSVTDTVYLSFFYQPQGLGNDPEKKDSLRLEFWHPVDSVWNRIWSAEGSNLQPFKQVMIKVDTTYYKQGFQFRFLNYATLSGNVDHWHLDYVYLNDQRTFDDTLVNDVAFITDNYGMLNEFSAMPWWHYKTDTINFMAQEMLVDYKNNKDTTFAVFYKYQVRDENNNVIETYPTTVSSKVVGNYGILSEPHAVYNMPANDFYFPTNVTTNNTTSFQIKNYFDLSSYTDFLQTNDTVTSYQIFGNYYAYDDGSAEAAYGVQGVGAKLAYQFNIKASDTLTAIDIYFNPVVDNKAGESFKLTVWSSLSPENIVYQQTAYYTPIYSSTDKFLTYTLDNPVYLPAGTYYFGWEKITGNVLNVGFDKNNNTKSKIWYDALGAWTNASFEGSLMLRPVFRNYVNPVVNVNEINNELSWDLTLYPNPVKDKLYFNTNQSITNVVVYNTLGEIILNVSQNAIHSIDLSSLAKGFYVVACTNTNHETKNFKILVND